MDTQTITVIVVALGLIVAIAFMVGLLLDVSRYVKTQKGKTDTMLLELQRQSRLMAEWSEHGLPVKTPKQVRPPAPSGRP